MCERDAGDVQSGRRSPHRTKERVQTGAYVPGVNCRLLCAVGLGAAMLAGEALRAQPSAAGPTPATDGAATAAPAARQTEGGGPIGQPQPAVIASATPQGGTIKGTVKAGTTPLPGVAVTATNSLTGKKYATTTDIDGVY